MLRRRSPNYWTTGFTLGAVVVAAVAGLLLAIIATARSILSNARRALEVADRIAAGTRPIWELDRTNEVAGELLKGAESIERHAAAVADALTEHSAVSSQPSGDAVAGIPSPSSPES